MAFTFLKTLENVKIGKSLFDKKGAEIVQRLVDLAKEKNVKLYFPVDFTTGMFQAYFCAWAINVS